MAAHAAETAPAADAFEKTIRPLLSAKCHSCHGPQMQMGGLNLATVEGLRKGAASGPILDTADPDNSRLLRAVSHQTRIKMPPAGKLSDGEIASLREWVRAGTPWPSGQGVPSKPAELFWSFRPVQALDPPTVKNAAWVRNDIDRFLLAKLESQGIEPAPPADRLTFLRRATFDLTGLPPTEQEVREFVGDRAPDAVQRMVDRLLSSPRYGEQWGRHWMDVARYADSTGADEDHRYPYAWRYRDYVLDAFNRDLPFDQFVREQVAGDLLPAGDGSRVNLRGIIATGFLALGPKLIAEQDKPKMFYDIVDEQIEVTGRAFLGLTLACARCHDHKFDPVSTKDYYSLASIFASTRQLEKLEGTVSQLYFAPLVPPEEAARWRGHKLKLEEKQKEIDEVVGEEAARHRDRLSPRMARYMLAAREVYKDGKDLKQTASRTGLDAAILQRWVDYLKPTKERRPHLEPWYQSKSETAAAEEYQSTFTATDHKRREAREQWKREAAEAKAKGGEPPPPPKFLAGDNRFYTEVIAEKGPLALPEKNRETLFTGENRHRFHQLTAELKTLKDTGPPDPPLACGVAEDKPVTQRVFIRGNPAALGDEVPKRFPIVLAGHDQTPITQGSGRLELARWLSGRTNPLTARVMVNRIWQWHFGEGLVRTPSNFGRMGERPTHPELLDYLANRFMEGGWSLKAMHRLIMLSNAYQMSSRASAGAMEKDSDNRLWSRFQRRRLAVEEMRDSLLAIDGSLDVTMGGSLQKGEGTDKEFSDDRKSLSPDESKRRLVYLPLRRSNLPSVLNLFDFGDATTTSEGRTQTNVAPQALYMMNSGYVSERAKALAQHLLRDTALTDEGRIERAYYRVVNRPPDPDETRQAVDYVSRFPARGDGVLAWSSFCRSLIASNDFLYIH